MLICDAQEVNKKSIMLKFNLNSRINFFINNSFLINRAREVFRFFVVENTLKMLKLARAFIKDYKRSLILNRKIKIF